MITDILLLYCSCILCCLQVIHLQELPSISDWLSSTYPLCPVVVDTEKAIENAGSNSLQVRYIMYVH